MNRLAVTRQRNGPVTLGLWSDFSGYEFTASARPAQPADHAIARATAKIVQRTESREEER